ncbi:hypothetical protein FPOAC2_12955 [Fusarium poae]|uniref:hypothetical protein n=1 Tax=Fusarium poae TaxID=36050 RepID=UPI001CE94CA7|nr:hypothetical protein FPOAC1_012594 [Fusarium poae]KAG8667755.1 hypothetical protein FPOAC1_012594 [Fusarium poae]
MAEILFSSEIIDNVKGKVVVMTGGAQGIGAATVSMLYDRGAHVYFGDWDDIKGQQVVQHLQSSPSKQNGGSVHFRKLDVRDYNAQVQLFKTPYDEKGHVDVAISCAGVTEPDGGWFAPDQLNLETVMTEPEILKANVDINLTSVVYFSRIALAFLSADKTSTASNGFSKSIVLVSSVAGITEGAGLYAYSAGKHGVIGLMRSLRGPIEKNFGVRVNAVCPWGTDTQMIDKVRSWWTQNNLPLNQPSDVGNFIVQLAADETLNGKSVLVAGGRGFDTEEGIDKHMPEWFGEFMEEFLRGQKALGTGGSWSGN